MATSLGGLFRCCDGGGAHVAERNGKHLCTVRAGDASFDATFDLTCVAQDHLKGSTPGHTSGVRGYITAKTISVGRGGCMRVASNNALQAMCEDARA